MDKYKLVVALLLIFLTMIGCQRVKEPLKNQSHSPTIPQRTSNQDHLAIHNSQFSHQQTLSSQQTNTALVSFLGEQAIEPQFPVSIWELEYQMQLPSGEWTSLVGNVFIPINGPSPATLVVYGAGTTGIDDRCAPSREDPQDPSLGNYQNQMISMASQGLIVLLPNYEGLDNPQRIHYYYHKQLEGLSMLSAVKAYYSINQSRTEFPINQVFLAGYSQGGHAAFSAADLASDYLPDISIHGILGHGPVTDPKVLLQRNPNLAAYFVYAYQTYYPEFNADLVIPQEQRYLVEQAPRLCADEGFSYGSITAEEKYTDTFYTALFEDQVTDQLQPIIRILDQNNAGTKFTNIPVFIAQGTTDPIITEQDQDQFVRSLEQRDIPVTYQKYPDVHHFYIRQRSFQDSLRWIRQQG